MKPPAKIRVLVWMGIALIHFGASNLILPLTTALVNRSSGAGDGPGLAVTILVRATRLLHVPLVTLALYPREWFPGDWIYLPMAANSLIWATGICWLIRVFRKTP